MKYKRLIEILSIVCAIAFLILLPLKANAKECQPIGSSSDDCNGGNCILDKTLQFYSDCNPWAFGCEHDSPQSWWCDLNCQVERLQVGKCEQIVCNRNDQCQNGEICIAGICAEPDGTHCASNAHCTADELCINGFCHKSECLTSADCPTGQICITQADGLRKCESCGCPEGYKCGFILYPGAEAKKICIKTFIPYP